MLSGKRVHPLPELKFPGEVYQLNNLPKLRRNFQNSVKFLLKFSNKPLSSCHKGWEYFQKSGFGFPDSRNTVSFFRCLFPQFKENPVTNVHINAAQDWGNPQ
jgi:putative transposase